MKAILLTILTLALVSLTFAADHPNFTGTWKLDTSRAGKGTGGSLDTIRKVTQEGNVITVTETRPDDGNDGPRVSKVSTDGSEVSSELRGQTMKSHGTWDDDKLVSDSLLGDYPIHQVWTLSEDGKTWTETSSFGKHHPITAIYLKQ